MDTFLNPCLESVHICLHAQIVYKNHTCGTFVYFTCLITSCSCYLHRQVQCSAGAVNGGVKRSSADVNGCGTVGADSGRGAEAMVMGGDRELGMA